MKRSQLLIIFLVVFIVLVGFGLIMPLIPFYVATYGGSQLVVGLLIATYAGAQFIGAPLLGRMSDRIGRRPILALSMAGTVAGFLILALAEPLGIGLGALFSNDPDPARLLALQNQLTLAMMVLSRSVSGLFGGSITVAQAYIADITDESNRNTGMGMIGAAFGLGFIVGPVMGGLLSQWGFAAPAYAAAILAALSLAGIFLLPESLTAERKAELARRPKQLVISLSAIFQKMGQPRIGPLLTVRLFTSMGASLFMALFTLWAKDRLGLDARPTSLLMAYNGLLSVFAQIVLIGPLTKRYSFATLITMSSAALGVSLFLWALTPNVPILMLVMIPYSLAFGVANTVIGSATTWAVPPSEMGDALGASSSLESLSRVISPTLGSWLLGAVGAWAPGMLGAAILAGLTVFSYQRLVLHPDPPLSETVFLKEDVEETVEPLPAAQLA